MNVVRIVELLKKIDPDRQMVYPTSDIHDVHELIIKLSIGVLPGTSNT